MTKICLNGLQELLSNKTKALKYYYTEDLTEDYLCFPVPKDETILLVMMCIQINF